MRAAVVFGCCWLPLAAVKYFAVGLGRAIPLPEILYLAPAWLLAAIGTAVSARMATRRLGRRGAAGWALATAAVIALMVCVNWVHFHATTWYAMHRSEYAAVLRDAEHRVPTEPLPEDVLSIDTGNGPRVWYIRVWKGFLACSAGYAHFDGSPEKYMPGVAIDSHDYLDDGLGCALRPTVEVGDGWWWVE